MTQLETAIAGLSDQRAIELVKRFARAHQGAMTLRALDAPLASSIGQALSLPDESIDPPSAGQLARSALLLLASDPRHRDGIAALLGESGRVAFGPGGDVLEPGDVLAVLQTQLPVVNPVPGTRSAFVHDASQQSGLLRSLTQQWMVYAGLRGTGPKADAEYRVWYATTRRPVDPADPSQGYTGERDDHVHYGTCRVFVPRSHKIGSVGSPWWKRAVTLTDDRLRLLAVERATEGAFWQSVAESLAACPEEERDAVVFVHGFNVDFQEAAMRAAQLGFDLQVRGAMAFFSWASRGEVKRYAADEASVELDEDVIADYMSAFALKTGARRVHVIAHSMGNRAVLRAVERIAREAERRTGVRFGQFILAAPDVDARKFRQLCAAYRAVSERTTVYVSSRDLAVEASRWLHDYPRAGLLPPVMVADGIDTVNVVNADVTLLGHGYVAEARSVISDIHALIRHGAPPQKRFGLQSMSTEQGGQYWLIGA